MGCITSNAQTRVIKSRHREQEQRYTGSVGSEGEPSWGSSEANQRQEVSDRKGVCVLASEEKACVLYQTTSVLRRLIASCELVAGPHLHHPPGGRGAPSSLLMASCVSRLMRTSLVWPSWKALRRYSVRRKGTWGT